MRYDQRNNIIIAFGLGFTVIPIIFSIAEDSLSNVPYSMAAASMALGASRWQTLLAQWCCPRPVRAFSPP